MLDTRRQKEPSSQGVWTQTLILRVLNIPERFNEGLLHFLLHKVVQASNQDDFQTPPCGGIPGISKREKTPGQT